MLPARNAEPTTVRAVESLLEGTLQDLRLLAADAGSTMAPRAVRPVKPATRAWRHLTAVAKVWWRP
ncbi:glycosyltransferase family 2 protein [Myxococcus sp. QH3KD-4-1]|nr:glycosyltransferase family 2 protein [Myxococcus qinghaiensis]